MAFGTPAFLNLFPNTKLSHLPIYGSDYVIVRIDLEPPVNCHVKKKVKLFRFEEVGRVTIVVRKLLKRYGLLTRDMELGK